MNRTQKEKDLTRLLKAYGLSKKQVLKVLSLSDSINYTCVYDYQGTGFKYGETMSVREWVVWAIGDRWNCCEEELETFVPCLLSQKTQKAMIEYIGDYWTIDILRGNLYEVYTEKKSDNFNSCDNESFIVLATTMPTIAKATEIMSKNGKLRANYEVKFISNWTDTSETPIIYNFVDFKEF